MKFSISVHSDDGTQIDYSINLLSAANAVSFINGWQAQQEAFQQSFAADSNPAESVISAMDMDDIRNPRYKLSR